MDDINYLLILFSSFAACSSPGPATLAIAGTSMNQGRRSGLALAAGIFTGSLIWSASAAFGLAAMLHTNVWLFEIMRYFGAAYLIYLAVKSARSAMHSSHVVLPSAKVMTSKALYIKGLLIHLTNPKAILFLGSLYSIGVPATAEPTALLSVIGSVAMMSGSIFFGYALLFSNGVARRVYLKSKVLFESVFALFFGAAGFKLLTSGLGKSV
jgi:threonine/homoserine/homoserine lactone efflux protein